MKYKKYRMIADDNHWVIQFAESEGAEFNNAFRCYRLRERTGVEALNSEYKLMMEGPEAYRDRIEALVRHLNSRGKRKPSQSPARGYEFL